MFNCIEDDYQSSLSFNPQKEAEEAPVVKSHGEPVKEVASMSIKSIDPPSAESMLRKLRQKLKGRGLKEI